MNMDKYEVQYRTLVQKYNSDLHHQSQMNELFYNENINNIMDVNNMYDNRLNSNLELQQRPRRNSFSDLNYNQNNNFNVENSMESRFSSEIGRRNSGGEYVGLGSLIAPSQNFDLESTVPNNSQNNQRLHKNMQQPQRPSLKLKIHLGRASSEASYKKRRSFLGYIFIFEDVKIFFIL